MGAMEAVKERGDPLHHEKGKEKVEASLSPNSPLLAKWPKCPGAQDISHLANTDLEPATAIARGEGHRTRVGGVLVLFLKQANI